MRVEPVVMHRILSLGDSYTIGESVEPQERWPVQLARLLRENNLDASAPTILAKTGWTTNELANAVARASPAPPYDLVTLLIGVNDQYRGHAQADYRSAFSALLTTSISLAGGEEGRVIVVSIPDWGMTPFAETDPRTPELITEEVAAFNQVNRAVSADLGARYVDVFPVSQLAYADPGLIADDGLHPSGAQYRRWAKEILPEARGALSRA